MDQRELIQDHEEGLRAMLEGHDAEVWHCLPGYVVEFDPLTFWVTVQVTTKFLQTLQDGTQQWIDMAPIPGVPLVLMGGGGFTLAFTPQANDECLVFFADRCIDGWWSKSGIQIPPSLRTHSLSDGFCIVGPRSKPNLLSNLSTNAQLRTNDGAAYIELTAAGSVNVLAPSGAKIIGNVEITGNLQVDGVTVGAGEGTFNMIPVSSHVHPGVIAGGADTGVPIP